LSVQIPIVIGNWFS